MLPFAAMKRELVRDTALLLALAIAVGTAANMLPGRRLPWWGHGQVPPQAGVDFILLDALEADTLRTSLPSVVVIDTRSAEEFAAGHVPGAVPVSLAEVGEALDQALLARLRAADAVILYGASEETDVEQLLAQELHHRGLAPPYVVVGGWAGWLAVGLSPEEGPR